MRLALLLGCIAVTLCWTVPSRPVRWFAVMLLIFQIKIVTHQWP